MAVDTISSGVGLGESTWDKKSRQTIFRATEWGMLKPPNRVVLLAELFGLKGRNTPGSTDEGTEG